MSAMGQVGGKWSYMDKQLGGGLGEGLAGVGQKEERFLPPLRARPFKSSVTQQGRKRVGGGENAPAGAVPQFYTNGTEGVEMDGLALGVTGPTLYNWCRDLDIDIDDYQHPVAVDQGD